MNSFKVINNKIVLHQLKIQQIYDYNLLIITHNNCNYIFYLDEKFRFKQSYIVLGNIRLVPSKIKDGNFIFTNNVKFWSNYIRNKNFVNNNTIQEYKYFIEKQANKIKIININNFKLFNNITLNSKSQLITFQIIYNWWFSIKRDVLFYPKKTLMIYNFFNFALYKLSRNKFNLNNQVISHKLLIDMDNNRCINDGLINFLNLKKDSDVWNNINSLNKKMYYKIDYSSSFIHLLSIIIQCQIKQQDKYYYFYKKFNDDNNYDRQEIKKKVFKILFSNLIKKYMHIPFFEKAYYFSIYLTQYYNTHGYINSYISQKKIIIQKNINKNVILNYFIMSLQTQLYLGILSNLLSNKNNINVIIFIYDSFIMQINEDISIEQIKQLKSILNINGLLKIKQYLGKSLNSLQKII